MRRFLLLCLLIPFISFSQTQIGQDIVGENLMVQGGEILWNEFGTDISFNADGTRMVVGGNGYQNNRGRVRVFEYVNNTWTQIGQSINGLGTDTNWGIAFGWRVAMSADGNVIAASAPGFNAIDDGYVKVYEFNGATWVQKGHFTDGIYTAFGYGLELSSDGNRIAISTPKKWANGERSGQVRVFEYVSGEYWEQIGQDLNGDIYNEFGTSLDLSANGHTLIVGSLSDSSSSTENTVAKIFKYQTGTWVEAYEITHDINEQYVGRYVEMNANGDFFTVWSQYLNTTEFEGQIKVYKEENNSLTQIGDALRNNSISSFGILTKISNDGTVLLVGSPYADFEVQNTGQVDIYQNQLGVWTPVLNSYLGTAPDDLLGYAIDLTSDGTKFSFSIPREDVNNDNNIGVVRAFDMAEELALLEVVDDIFGNANGVNVSSEQLNAIDGVSGAIDGVDYTDALQNGTYADPNNPTPAEIQTVIDAVNDTLSLDENSIQEIKLYPNPTKTSFTIQLNDTSEIESITIYNVLGQEVLRTTSLEVDTSKLSSGSYIVELQTTKGKSSKKLIIE